MSKTTSNVHRQLMAVVLLTGVAVGSAWGLSRTSGSTALWLVAGLTFSLVAFLRTQFALMLLIVAMLLSPEISVGRTEGATLGRGITLRIDDFLIFIVAFSWFLKTAIYKELNLLKSTSLNRAALLYALACILPTLVGMEAGRVAPMTGSLFLLKYLEYLMVFWMVVNNVDDEKQLKRFLVLLFIVALVVSLMAIAQIPSGGRVSAPFEGKEGEPNTLGGYLVFMMALLTGIACSASRYRLPALAVLGVLFIPFVYTLSRSSYLAVLPMVLSVLLLSRKYILILILGVIVGGLFLFPSSIPRVVRQRVEFTFKQEPRQGQSVILGHRLDTSTSARLESFSAAFQDFQQKPILGWGVTGWHFIDSQYFRTLVETGLLGLAAFLYLIYRVLLAAWVAVVRFRESEPLYCGLSCGFIAGTIGLMFHAVGANTFIIVRIMEPFWLVCALIYLLPEIAGKPEQPAHTYVQTA